MRKILASILVVMLLAASNLFIDLPTKAITVDPPSNLFTSDQSSFENGSANGWGIFGGGSLSVTDTRAYHGDYSLRMTNRSQPWMSPSYNIYSKIKASGAGTYAISMWVYFDYTPIATLGRIIIRGYAADENSFIKNNSGNYYGYFGAGIQNYGGTWRQYTATVKVLASDIAGTTGTFNLMLDGIDRDTVYIDKVYVTKLPETYIFNGDFDYDALGWDNYHFNSGRIDIDDLTYGDGAAAKYTRAYISVDILQRGSNT